MENENIILNFDNKKEYDITDNNIVGASIDVNRYIENHNDSNCKYVKKFGTAYAIGDITNAVISTPRGTLGTHEWKYEFYNQNDTLLGYVIDNGSSTYTDVTAETSTSIYIRIVSILGNITITDGDIIVLTTDIDTGGLSIYLSGETTAIDLYVSASGSTYYDNNYMYGGYRHTPTGVKKYPYFTINAGRYSAAIAGLLIVTILDSEYYDEIINEFSETLYVQSDTGQIANVFFPIGQDVHRTPKILSNNSNTIYISDIGGSDISGNGTFQLPYKTLEFAINNIGSKTCLKFIDNSIYYLNNLYTLGSGITIEADYNFTPEIIFSNELDIGNIYNCKLNGNNNAKSIIPNLTNLEFCDIYNFINVINNTNVSYNKFYNNTIACSFQGGGSFYYNIVYNNTTGVSSNIISGTLNISENIFYNNSNKAIDINLDTAGTVNISNNIISKNTTGININDSGSGITLTINNNISYNNTTDIISNRNITINDNDYLISLGVGVLSGTGNINIDPIFVNSSNNDFGLGANSPCLVETHSSFIGTGMALVISDNTSGSKYIGLNLIGNEICNFGLVKGGVNLAIDCYVYNCTFSNFKNFAVYESITSYTAGNQETFIYNSIIYNNGSGIKIAVKYSTIENNIIYNNSDYNILINDENFTVENNTCYNAKYGISISKLISSSSILNNISSNNSIYDIQASLLTKVTYNCFFTYSNIDISDSSNIIADPLFINSITEPFDFHL